MSENENGLFGGSGVTLIVLILFFLTMFNGGWGGNNGVQNALTRAEVQDEIQNASIQNAIANGFAGVNQNICNTSANQMLAFNNGINSVNSNLQNMSAQMASCCCDIKTNLGSKIDAIGDLIQQNTIQELRDKVQAKDLELAQSNILSINQNQTVNLINAMRTLINGGCGCSCS